MTVAIVLAIAVLGAGVLYAVHRRHCGNIRFDRARWIAVAGQGGVRNPRQRMVKDLMRRYLRNGMTKHEVRQLLGKPDYDSLYRDTDSYFIGVIGCLSVDASTLDVHYDKAGKVSRTQVLEH